MRAATVFDIHFLLDAICHDLTPRDIRRCLLVCRSWHANFEPYLWRTITVRKRITFNKIMSPKVKEKLVENARSVQSIDCIFAEIWPYFQKIPISNLTVLRSPSLASRLSNRINNQKYASNIIQLISASPHLQILETSFLDHPEGLSERFMMAIRKHVSLRELRVVPAISVYCKIVRRLLFSCGNLEKVHIQAYIYGYRQAETQERNRQELLELTGSETPTFKLKELSFKCQEYYNFNYCLIPTLRLCPHLERFAAPRLDYLAGYSDIADVLSLTAKRLQHLDMSAVQTLGSHAVLFINACVGLRTYRGAFHNTGVQEVYEALLRHSNTLEVLDLQGVGADSTTSAMIQRILLRCSALEQFLAMGPLNGARLEVATHVDPILKEGDLAVGHDTALSWACGRLRVLKLRVRGVVPEQLVLELGRLTQLEDLRLGWVRHTDEELTESEIGLYQKNVSRLLDVLSKLGKLKRLELRGLKEFIDKEALKKARRQWKDCEWVQYS